MTCVDHDTCQPGSSEQILNPAATHFLCALQRYFSPGRRELLAERDRRQHQFDMGRLPELHYEAEPVCERGLATRRSASDPALAGVILAGPPDSGLFRRGMHSGANLVIADFDDFLSPTWQNCLQCHTDLRSALCTTTAAAVTEIDYAPPPIFVRPRNWRLEEKHHLVDGIPMSASLFDFGLSIFNSVHTQSTQSATVHFAVSKLESRHEARLWSEILRFAEEWLNIPHGSNNVIVAVDTLSAASDMEGIIFELREYVTALECSPLNYLSSFVRSFRCRSESLLPQLRDITLSQPFMHAYQELLIHTCHKCEIAAISSFPQHLGVRACSEAEKSRVSLAMRGAIDLGFDGICIADAALLPRALSALDQNRTRRPANRRGSAHCHITISDLMSPSVGQITMAALKENVESAIIYLEGWLAGHGPTILASDVKNMSSTELSRAQLWQWLRHSARLTCGRRVSRYLIECIIRDVLASIEARMGGADFVASKFRLAAELLVSCCTDGYDSLVAEQAYPHLC